MSHDWKFVQVQARRTAMTSDEKRLPTGLGDCENCKYGPDYVEELQHRIDVLTVKLSSAVSIRERTDAREALCVGVGKVADIVKRQAKRIQELEDLCDSARVWIVREMHGDSEDWTADSLIERLRRKGVKHEDSQMEEQFEGTQADD
jgi:hypothetical protein